MNFLELNEEKQLRIVNSALKHFALKGYKKASAMDIAKEAGISKAMIFHYFGNKKEMYVYLITHITQKLDDYLDAYVDESITDIFDMITLSTKAKIQACGVYPFILAFISSVCKEKEESVQDVVQAYIEEHSAKINKMVDWRLDYSKFRDDIDRQTALKIMSLTAEGILSRFNNDNKVVASEQVEEYMECMLALKSILYREEEV